LWNGDEARKNEANMFPLFYAHRCNATGLMPRNSPTQVFFATSLDHNNDFMYKRKAMESIVVKADDVR
jgi:hypothetical protein